jgi:hypothetical protein
MIREFHLWHLVFNTSEEAVSHGHPTAPCLEQYHLTDKQVHEYFNAVRDIENKIEKDKLDKWLNALWFFLFIVGIIVLGFSFRNFELLFALLLYVGFITMGIYLWRHHHFKEYRVELDRLYSDELESYVHSVVRYANSEEAKSASKREQSNDKFVQDQGENSLPVMSERKFTDEEISAVDYATVARTDRGHSLCFKMKDGGMSFLPLSKQSKVKEDSYVDIKRVSVVEYGLDDGSTITGIVCGEDAFMDLPY